MMAATRQDAWTSDDDLLLAEVTLRHIREGSTQLAAFEEVGQKLGRTAAACGFRWNSTVRKKYEAAIQIAKAQRQKNKRKTGVADGAARTDTTIQTASAGTASVAESRSVDELSFDTVIRFLRQQKENMQRFKQLEKELNEKNEEIERLRAENEKMKSELDNVQTDYREINDDYKTLIRIMDRARKLAVLAEDEHFEDKTRFKMDSNGNLERVDK